MARIGFDNAKYISLQSDHKVGTDLRGWICIVVPVLLGGGAGVAHIVDHDVPDTFKHHTTAGIAVHLDDLLIHPIRRRSSSQFKDLFSGNDLVLINMPSDCQNSQEQNESEKLSHMAAL